MLEGLCFCHAVCVDEIKVELGFPWELLIRQAAQVGWDSGGGYESCTWITDFG